MGYGDKMKIRINVLIFPFVLLSYITNQMKVYAMLMVLVLLHELGHIIMGKCLRLKINSIEIMPFGCSIRFQEEYDNISGKIEKNRKKIMVASAGPIANILCIVIMILLKIEQVEWIYASLLIAIFNLLPIYPLDGGRILEAILDMKMKYKRKKQYLKLVAKVSMILLTILGSFLLFYYENILIFLGIFYMWFMLAKQKIKKTI